jgi:hypothetical protein
MAGRETGVQCFRNWRLRRHDVRVADRFQRARVVVGRHRGAKAVLPIVLIIAVLAVILLIWFVNELILPPLPMPEGAPSIIR